MSASDACHEREVRQEIRVRFDRLIGLMTLYENEVFDDIPLYANVAFDIITLYLLRFVHIVMCDKMI